MRALIIGNTDGIGQALTHRLLDLGWAVSGVSRRGSAIEHDAYTHRTADVTAADFPAALAGPWELCVYCAGIGEMLDLDQLEQERRVFEVNLLGAVRAIEGVLPGMLTRGAGHIIVLSSLADVMVTPDAPSYSASKAGLSSYVEGLAKYLRKQKSSVAVTNVRFGFVDTKMAKGDSKPFMMSVARAVAHIESAMAKRPVRYSVPWQMHLLTILLKILL